MFHVRNKNQKNDVISFFGFGSEDQCSELSEITAMFLGRCSVWRWPLSSSSDHHQPSFLSFHFSDTLFGFFSHFCLAAYLQFSSKLENIQHHLHNFTPHQHLLTPWWFASSSLQKCRPWFTTYWSSWTEVHSKKNRTSWKQTGDKNCKHPASFKKQPDLCINHVV